ncbi:DUF5641 domain-containing protein [Trichonephila clavipes]|nr:DUF5641 domain-containing protein [Trichonephila clavipes]
MSRTTACYKMKYGLAKTIKENIIKTLKETPFSLNLDESTSNAQEKIDKEIEAVEQYFDKIVTWRFRAKKQLGKNNKFKSDSDSCKTTEESKLIEPMKVKLPKLIIPKFYAEINQWLSFWNSFKTAIHDNNSLNSIDKFTYLKGLLGSSALATVEGFAITAENYAKAVEILKDRFGRKDAIINSHMQKLLSVTPLKRSDDTKVLRQFFDMCQTQIRSLESLDVSFESFSNVLCPLILNCLPSDLVLEFNKETDGSEYKLDELLKFLNKQISARERTESSISTQYIPHSQKIQTIFNRFKSENYKHNSQKINSSFRKQPFPAPTAANFIASSNEKNANELCLFCKHESHQTAICPWAKQKTLNERKDILMKLGACFKCLRIARHLSRDLTTVSKIFGVYIDVLGIKDPFEKKTRIELEKAAKDHFARHVTRDADGRYVVSLPWIQGHPFLSNCRNLAERRLKNCVRSLERSKNLGKYEAVFHSWQNENIIEEVQNVADKKNEHYLLHHLVYKDNSTTKIRPVFDGSAKEKKFFDK